jgi:hypothetical protein
VPPNFLSAWKTEAGKSEIQRCPSKFERQKSAAGSSLGKIAAKKYKFPPGPPIGGGRKVADLLAKSSLEVTLR